MIFLKNFFEDIRNFKRNTGGVEKSLITNVVTDSDKGMILLIKEKYDITFNLIRISFTDTDTPP